MQDTPQHGHLGVEDHQNWQYDCYKQTDVYPDLLKPVASNLLCRFNEDMAVEVSFIIAI